MASKSGEKMQELLAHLSKAQQTGLAKEIISLMVESYLDGLWSGVQGAGLSREQAWEYIDKLRPEAYKILHEEVAKLVGGSN